MKIPDAPLHEPAPAAASPLLERVKQIATGQLAPIAEKIDREGLYPREVLRALGEAGAYRVQMAAPRGIADYASAILAMADVSKVCMSTGFMMWCQDVCGLYIEQSGNQALIDRRLAQHLAGASLGGTGLSNPMKTFSGIETMLLKATRANGGYVVNGTLPWVSNIGPGHYFGAICEVEGASHAGGHQVMFLLDCGNPAVTLKHCPTFSGMEGTGTFSVRVSDLFIGDADLIADPVAPYIKRIKGAFILLQTGMALGVVQGSIDSMWQVEQQLGHVNQYLEDRPDELQGEANELAARILRLAATPFDGSRDYLLEVLDARAHGAELSLRASQSALLHQGARGYLMSAAPQRRIREAHFVAIVTPAIKHLRREMARLSAQEQPA
jgi:alkylation response protein AidB-like acyl-CoA dehydrogenase